jgi:hypothetical protein
LVSTEAAETLQRAADLATLATEGVIVTRLFVCCMLMSCALVLAHCDSSPPGRGPGSTGSGADDSCDYAFDGVCDEPDLCEPGTDTTDCESAGDAGTSGDSSSGGPTPGCEPLDTFCTTDSDCCSGICRLGSCATSECGRSGDVCNDSSDCCGSLTCDGVECGTCASNGASCYVDEDCCSGHCGVSGCSSSSCADVNEYCSADSDCCSGLCDPDNGCY